MVQKAEEQHLDDDVEVPAHKIWRAEDDFFGDETNQRLVESGTSAKLVDTSVRLAGDDFCMVARQKQIQTGVRAISVEKLGL